MFLQQVGPFICHAVLLCAQGPVFLAQALNYFQQAGYLFFKVGEFQINL